MRIHGSEYLPLIFGRTVENANASKAEIERRNNGPATVSVTETIFSTIELNVTVTQRNTIFVNTTIISTEFRTVTQTAEPVTHSQLIVIPSTVTTTFVPTLSRVPPELSPVTATASPAVTSQPSPSAASGHQLSSSALTAIVIAAVAFLALLSLCAFFGIRKYLKKYRAERVLRKKVQTEGNEMPDLPAYSNTDPLADPKVFETWH